MARKFQIKRGPKANLPTLAQGEFAMTTDSGAEALWLGTGTANKKIPLAPTAADVGAVSRDGDTMKGSLTVKAGYPQIKIASNTTSRNLEQSLWSDGTFDLINLRNTNNEMVFRIRPETVDVETALQFYRMTEGTQSSVYNVLHTGSKPDGSYTGNGDAAERKINIGGIGKALAIYTGATYFGFAFPSGAVLLNQSTKAMTVFPSSQVKFVNGVLTLAVGSTPNTASSTYYYQVL